MANQPEKMKSMVENLILNLRKQGITVDEAAVLKINNAPNTSNQQTQKTVNSILQEMNKQGLYPGDQLASDTRAVVEDQPAEECWCPNCFNFQNFEERLRPLGGNFDYPSVNFLGKTYDFKYFKANDGREFMMSQARRFEVNPLWTKETIQEQLNIAVQNKEFDKAQILLTALNQSK